MVIPEVDPKTGEVTAIYELGPVGVGGTSVESASAGLNQKGQWEIRPIFRDGADGIDKFNAAAAQCNPPSKTCPTGQIAVVLDNKVLTAPNIEVASFQRDQITISGNYKESEAKDIATALNYGALPVVLVPQTSEIVSATLGRDALHAGLIAGLVGFVLVGLYMIFFYRLLGLLAMVKLLIEGAILWAILCFLGAQWGLALTLAGITGIIVSIGVSLDSNVVYYEHMKEDVRDGRSRSGPRSTSPSPRPGARSWPPTGRRSSVPACCGSSPSVRCGASPSSSGSRRSSTSSRRTATCARSSAGPPTRSAALSTRTSSACPTAHPNRRSSTGRATVAAGRSSSMSAIGRLYRGDNDINFVKWWRRGLVLSAVLIVISVASLFTRGLNLGIDFEGGVSWEVKAPGVSVSEARSALDGVGEGQAKIQIVGTDTLRVQGTAAVRRQAGRGPPGAGRPGQDRHRRGHRSARSARRGARRSPSPPNAPWSCSSP